MPALNSKLKYEKLATAVCVLQNTQKLVISRCRFDEDAKKCTKIYNARVRLLFCSFNVLFGDVLVAIAVVRCPSVVKVVCGSTATLTML